jgi:alanyl-tRNA synthetase
MLKIYERDAYVFEFEANVASAEGEWIALDATAFYPGGGGQAGDTGRMCGLDVKETKKEGNGVLHRVPGHSMKAGDSVWCTVDWDRRYDLMMGHTAEHLFFGALKRIVPDIGIVKICIAPDSKYVVVDRSVEWDEIKKAQESVNIAINGNLSVSRFTVDKDDPIVGGIRVKLEKIDGGRISVVEIGDADIAACSGVHVRETGEIAAFLADRKTSAGKDGCAIHFRVGSDAIARSMELANECIRTAEVIGSKPEDAAAAARNLKRDCDAKAKHLKSAVSRMIASLRPDVVDGVPVHSGIFETDDKAAIADAAEKIKNGGGIAAFLAKGDSLSAVLSSGAKKVDCSAIIKAAMEKAGGRGGGKTDFAQGGAPDASKAEEVLNSILLSIESLLKQEN